MNQIEIGKFIALCRKEKCLTQAQLAEKLNITDRAVSKWETGRNMPDASLMLDLCKELDISVNELLNARRIEMKDYDKEAEKTLIELKKTEEEGNRQLLFYEKVIGFSCSISFILLIFAASFGTFTLIPRILLIGAAVLIFAAGLSFALKIETKAGYYECKHCKHRFVPKFSSVYFAPHMFTTRYMKCPHCQKKSWMKKTLTKD